MNSTNALAKDSAAKPSAGGKSAHARLTLQRKCACGATPSSPFATECSACQTRRLQRKLEIGASNDPLEQQADQIADQVMSAPAGRIGASDAPRIQRASGPSSARAGVAPASVDRVLTGPGRSLEPGLQQDMGHRFGYDFSRVRVHTGPAAEQSARDVNAYAYTVGRNIVFGAGRFAPGTAEGRRLLAHELVHVVQQDEGGTPMLSRFHLPHGTAARHQLDETSRIAPTFADLLTTLRRIINASSAPRGLLGTRQVNMDELVQRAGGRTAAQRIDPHSGGNVPYGLNFRYLFTCRCGLIDMRHFIQLMYIANFAASTAPGVSGNRVATRMGRQHELTSESESRFGAEDTPTNALGAYTGQGLAGLPQAGDLFSAIERTLTRCAPVDFNTLSTSSRDTVRHFYGDLRADPAHAGDLIPRHQNQTAVPDIISVPECSGERSFPYALDTSDPHRKTIARPAFEHGSSGLTSDSDIRDFVTTQRPEIIRGLSGDEKVRLARRLFQGWVSDEDLDALETIYNSASSDVKARIRAAIDPVDLQDLGQRLRLRMLFDH